MGKSVIKGEGCNCLIIFSVSSYLSSVYFDCHYVAIILSHQLYILPIFCYEWNSNGRKLNENFKYYPTSSVSAVLILTNDSKRYAARVACGSSSNWSAHPKKSIGFTKSAL